MSTLTSLGSDAAVVLASEQPPMRVCFMLNCLGLAGIECQIALLLKYLDRSQVEPYVCLLHAGESDRLIDLDMPEQSILRLNVRSLKSVSALGQARRLASFLRRERIDVLHPLHPDSLYFGAPVAKWAGVPSVVRFRVDEGYWMTATDRWLGRALNWLVDATMVNCEAARQAVIDLERVAPESITIVPNGVDLARFVPADNPKQQPVGDDLPCVGVVANLRPVKNLDVLVRAAAEVLRVVPNARFQIAGEGESRPQLEALIAQLGLQRQVTLLGAVADVPAFLRSLSIAVLCSSSEGSPNAIMEYMAARLPIVSTDVGGCGELLGHGRHGLLVPPGNPNELAPAIVRLLVDRELASRLAASGHRRVQEEFSVEAQARRYEAFYRQALARKSRQPAWRQQIGSVGNG